MQGSRLKLNAAKCIFKAKQVVFCRHLVHTNGLSSDPLKVQTISNMPVPSNKTELQSYIGMCTFLSSYQQSTSGILRSIPITLNLEFNMSKKISMEQKAGTQKITELFNSKSSDANQSQKCPSSALSPP